MKAYLGYVRVSTVKQGERGSSLVEQRSAIEAYATRNNLTISSWFEERETAAKGGRRVFNTMLAELRRRRAIGVIIHKIDRSARNLKDWATLGELVDAGVEVHFSHETLDLRSRGGRLAADIQAVVAADYVRNLRDEVLKGFYGRLKQGFYPLPAPLGYLDRGKAEFKVIDPIRGPLVREAFELYGTGNYSLDVLAALMGEKGLRTLKHRSLSRSALAMLLHNTFYYGTITIRSRNEVFDGGHEPLIPKSLYDRAQWVMSGRAAIFETVHNFPYRKLIVCQSCKRFLTGELQKGNVYYRCHGKGCREPSVRQDRLEETIFDALRSLRLADDELGDLHACAEAYLEQSKVERAAKRDQNHRDLALAEDRLQKLTDGYLDGVVDKETYTLRRVALVDERETLREAIRTPEATETEKTAAILQIADDARARFPTATTDERRQFLQALASGLSAGGGRLQLDLRFPFDHIAGSQPARPLLSP